MTSRNVSQKGHGANNSGEQKSGARRPSAEQHRAEQYRAEQSRVEQSRVEQDDAEKPGVDILDLDAIANRDNAASFVGPRLQPDDLAYVIYTSGTTGRPKGVEVSHRAIASAYQAWETLYQLRPGMRHLQMASAAFDVCTGDLVRALGSGGALIFCARETLLDPANLHAVGQERGRALRRVRAGRPADAGLVREAGRRSARHPGNGGRRFRRLDERRDPRLPQRLRRTDAAGQLLRSHRSHRRLDLLLPRGTARGCAPATRTSPHPYDGLRSR